MKIRLAVAILVVLAFTLSAAYANYVRIGESNFVAMGWKRTLKTGPETGQSCGFRGGPSNPQGVLPDDAEGVHPSPKRAASTNLSWASLSTQLFQGKALSTLTCLTIRTCGYEGDGASWEPPSIYLGLVNAAGTGNRSIRALPWATWGRGSTKTYYVYNLVSPSTKWFCYINAAIYTGIAAVEAAWGPLTFASEAFLTPPPGSTAGIWSGQSFNVFSGCALNEEIKYSSSTRGTVDWVEVGFSDGTYYMFDFVVPEPGSIVALAAGLIGFIGLRRRF